MEFGIHHSYLPGLLEDSHTQYLLIDGSRAMTDKLDVNGDIHLLGDEKCLKLYYNDVNVAEICYSNTFTAVTINEDLNLSKAGTNILSFSENVNGTGYLSCTAAGVMELQSTSIMTLKPNGAFYLDDSSDSGFFLRGGNGTPFIVFDTIAGSGTEGVIGYTVSTQTFSITRALTVTGITTLSSDLKMSGNDIILDSDLDTYIGTDETGGDHIHYNIGGIEVFHMHEACFQGVDACAQFISDEVCTDPDIVDSGEWTVSTAGAPGSTATFNASDVDLVAIKFGGQILVTNTPGVIESGRTYYVEMDVDAWNKEGSLRLYVGGQYLQMTVIGTNTGKITTTTAADAYIWASGGSVNNTATISGVRIRLLPATSSSMGDLTIYDTLTVKGDVTMYQPTFDSLTITQAQIALGNIRDVIEVTGSNGASSGASGYGSSMTFTCGSGFDASSVPSTITAGRGGDYNIIAGDGGDVTDASDTPGDGGDVIAKIGIAGTGGTGNSTDGHFLISDTADAALVTVDAETFTFRTHTGIIKKTSRYTSTQNIPVTDSVVYLDTDSAGFTATLPAGVNGQELRIINVGSSNNTAVIAPNGADNIYGANSNVNLYDSEAIILTYETTEGWW
jgi:hypothetical protein